MTQKGMAGKAVGAAVLCSAIGGVASALVMMSATEPLAKWAIMNIGPPEIFALVFFGLAVASSVGGRTIWKGWLSVLLGLLIATIGQDPVGGINRFNFGYSDLAAGCKLRGVLVLGSLARLPMGGPGSALMSCRARIPKTCLGLAPSARKRKHF